MGPSQYLKKKIHAAVHVLDSHGSTVVGQLHSLGWEETHHSALPCHYVGAFVVSLYFKIQNQLSKTYFVMSMSPLSFLPRRTPTTRLEVFLATRL
jgi:hypothetical protein